MTRTNTTRGLGKRFQVFLEVITHKHLKAAAWQLVHPAEPDQTQRQVLVQRQKLTQVIQ